MSRGLYRSRRPGVACQDTAGRLWDVLTMLRFAIRASNGGAREVLFGVHVRDDNRQRTPPLVRLKAICGPGDRGEPVITVMVPEEDCANRGTGQWHMTPRRRQHGRCRWLCAPTGTPNTFHGRSAFLLTAPPDRRLRAATSPTATRPDSSGSGRRPGVRWGGKGAPVRDNRRFGYEFEMGRLRARAVWSAGCGCLFLALWVVVMLVVVCAVNGPDKVWDFARQAVGGTAK
jgi:hypothetical protein